MRLVLLKYWDRIRSGFWFLPALMAIVSVAMAYTTVALDTLLQAHGAHAWSWVYTGGAEGASAVLTAISGSMITIAGLVFSMTLVAMSLAASNFGPRLLQNFMRDTANQVVLGTFVATFLYCLLVLRTIRRVDEGAFVPHVAVSLGVLFALGSLGVLIYFIHHVAVSIQADQIITRVGEELTGRVEIVFPQQIGESKPTSAATKHAGQVPESFDREARDVPAITDGYLQLVDADALMELAIKENVIFHLERRPGQYVVAGYPLIRVWPGARLTDQLATAVHSSFVLGSQRTAAQDLEYLVGQLVEIAVRALSPGINDPFTAITCIDRLGSALTRLAERDVPSPLRYDEHDALRIIAPGTTFALVADVAFGPIRRYGCGSAEVTLRLLDTLEVIGRAVQRPEDRAVLRRHAGRIVRGACAALPARCDRWEVKARYHSIRPALRDPVTPKGKGAVLLAGKQADGTRCLAEPRST